MRRTLVTLCLAAATALAPAPAAWADGDPASDVLLSQDVFFPYAPNKVSKPVEQALTTTVKRAKAKGYPVKIALIADARDLGSVGQMLGRPQEYADLLTSEVSLNVGHGRTVEKARVLTVHPSGLGGNNLGDDAGDALAGVLPTEGEGPDGLARTAALAVGKLAAADGKPFALPALPAAAGAPTGGGGIPGWLALAVPVVLLGLAIVGVNRLTGRAAAQPDEPITSA